LGADLAGEKYKDIAGSGGDPGDSSDWFAGIFPISNRDAFSLNSALLKVFGYEIICQRKRSVFRIGNTTG